jgi:hypothetical protein
MPFKLFFHEIDLGGRKIRTFFDISIFFLTIFTQTLELYYLSLILCETDSKIATLLSKRQNNFSLKNEI